MIPSIVALVFLSAACTSQQAGTPGANPGTDGGTAASGSGANAANLSCMQVLQCVSECADSDTACPDACANKGSPDGTAKAVALATCIQDQGCTESTCVETKCKTSVDACVASSAPSASGTPLSGSAPAGNVPSDLVGAWSRTAYGTTHTLTLNADGTGSWLKSNASANAGCIQLNSTTEKGNVVVSADKITVYATDVSKVQRVCSAAETTTTGAPNTEEFSFTRPDATTLVIVDAGCAKGYADSPSSATFYCGEQLTRM